MTEHACKRPGTVVKALIVVALVIASAAAMVARQSGQEETPAKPVAPEALADGPSGAVDSTSDTVVVRVTDSVDVTTSSLPMLVDLGAGQCIPCRMMAPILETLAEEYRGRFEVVFIDVWENRSAGDQYDIRVIPTQIFFDAQGTELFRHEGFFSKEDILGTWERLGIGLAPAE